MFPRFKNKKNFDHAISKAFIPLNISLISYLNIWVFLYDSIVAKIFFKNQSINWKGEREEGGDSGDVEGTNYLFAVGLP